MKIEKELKMTEQKYMQRAITLWFMVLIMALLIMAAFAVYGVDASNGPYWMVIHEGYGGLEFNCASTNPYEEVIPFYADSSEMTLEQYTPYALHPNDLEVMHQIIEVSYCNLDVIYAGRGDDYSFVWRFTERVTDGHIDHRHFTRGASWIRMLAFEN